VNNNRDKTATVLFLVYDMYPRLQSIVVDSGVIVSDNRCCVNGVSLFKSHGQDRLAGKVADNLRLASRQPKIGGRWPKIGLERSSNRQASELR
jgi:hypothetical protein